MLFLYSAHQGLGLLINLVEYSSRNRHCLVDMEYCLDSTCLEDSLVQPADPTQAETAVAVASAPPCTVETQGDGCDKPESTGALAALVKVWIVSDSKDILTIIVELFGLQGSFRKKYTKTEILTFTFLYSAANCNTSPH